MILVFLPTIFIHENVLRFPAHFLEEVLHKYYHVECHEMDPADLTAFPVCRMRRYTICRLKSKLTMYKSLAEVCSALAFSGQLCLKDLLVASVPENSVLYQVTESMQKYLDNYLAVAPDDEVFDLTQNAYKRKRACSGKLMTLTKGCSHLWVQHLSRKFCLSA